MPASGRTVWPNKEKQTMLNIEICRQIILSVQYFYSRENRSSEYIICIFKKGTNIS